MTHTIDNGVASGEGTEKRLGVDRSHHNTSTMKCRKYIALSNVRELTKAAEKNTGRQYAATEHGVD